jgi:hypothetical protein
MNGIKVFWRGKEEKQAAGARAFPQKNPANPAETVFANCKSNFQLAGKRQSDYDEHMIPRIAEQRIRSLCAPFPLLHP